MPGAHSSLPLKVLLDENVPRAVGSWLRRRRPTWWVVHTSDVGLQGRSDAEVFSWAQENSCLIITFDDDFADRRSFAAGAHRGIIRLRVWPTTADEARGALGRLLEQTDDQDLRGATVIVRRTGVRSHRGTPSAEYEKEK